MEQFFSSLSKRQTMLLLTGVTFGGQNSTEAFDHLPPDDAEVLKHRAQEMLQIPREKRIPLLVQEIKRLVTSRRGDLRTADPEALAALLTKERAALTEIVLKAVPVQIAEHVRKYLPRREVSLKKEVKPEILKIVRWKLEDRLTRVAIKKGVFKFTDVLILQSRELVTICDRMGARALATAIAGLPDAEREQFLNAMPPDQRQLAIKASTAGMSRKLSENDAKTVLKMHGALENPSTGMRSAGTQRFARACVAQSPDFPDRVLERHSGEFGRLLAHWVKEERRRPTSRGDGGRGDIVEQMERLAQKGVIDRPMRLPLPPKRSAGPMAPGQLPGGKVLPPPPRAGIAQRPPPMHAIGRPALEPLGEMKASYKALRPVDVPRAKAEVLVPAPPRRDFMAERAARQAGAASSQRMSPVARDPIAEREARKAGAVSRALPPVIDRAPMQKPRQAPPRHETTGSKILRPREEDTNPPAGPGEVRRSPSLERLPQKRQPVQTQGTTVGRPPRPSSSSGRPGIIKGGGERK